MELFYAESVNGSILTLGAEESAHCAKVLRHREGDRIQVADGMGNLHNCRILSLSPREVTAASESSVPGWGDHSYRLTMAVCPTKNVDRYEWFIEKAVEMGVDRIVPVIGDHSERSSIRPERLQRIIVSAAKQSLKARLPQLSEPLTVKEFLLSSGGDVDGTQPPTRAKFIACCFEDGTMPRISLKQAIADHIHFPSVSRPYCDSASAEPQPESAVPAPCDLPEITVLIGPEGDFSAAEVSAAISAGYIPVHLGPSRLRTETAAVVATAFVYNASL